MPFYLGLDFGTSGARAIAIDSQGTIHSEQSCTFDRDRVRQPACWKQALFELIRSIPENVRSQICRIAIDGTSATVLLCDAQGQPLLPPLMYDDRGDSTFLEQLHAVVPEGHCILSASSSLVKLLTFQSQREFANARYFLHQADWLAYLLHGQLGISDYHNSLKLGYDPATESYPDWFASPVLDNVRSLLPRMVPPGTIVGKISAEVLSVLGLPEYCKICAGTTDSIAAFLASGMTRPGGAVTSLGSTLVLKLLSTHRIDRSEYGIYSHRLGPLWLVGGASNTGGAILNHFFSVRELNELSQRINPEKASPLQYYPLLKPGERFPINDPDLQPCLDPRPEDAIEFLHGLLESLSRIEAEGYRLLQQFGTTPLQQVLTAGGGAKNEAWRSIRERYLKVPVRSSIQEQAAYGTAQLARQGTTVNGSGSTG
jgi:D-ribulokinase